MPRVPQVPEEEEITEFFETYDLNKDDKVSFEEILEADEALRKEAPPLRFIWWRPPPPGLLSPPLGPWRCRPARYPPPSPEARVWRRAARRSFPG